MAAPTAQQHEVAVPEPSYCKLKHLVGSVFGAKLGRLKSLRKIYTLCQKHHEKILSEFKFLQLMIFKRNGQLRKEKSIQLLKRIQACLKRFHVGTKLYKGADDLLQDVVSNNFVSINLTSGLNELKARDGDCFLPARQMWIFTLYIQNKYTELLRVTASYCVSAFEHLSCQFSTGMLIPPMLLFMGAVSRIWFLSVGITAKLTQAYKEIFSVLEHVSQAPSQWKEPPLEPVTDKVKNEDDVNIPASHSEMSKMALQALAGGRLDSAHLEMDDDDGEDLGEPVTVQRSQVDENVNTRKRRIGIDDETEHVCVKKRKSEHSDSLKIKKIKSSKKQNKPKRKGIAADMKSSASGDKLEVGRKEKKKSEKVESMIKLMTSDQNLVKQEADISAPSLSIKTPENAILSEVKKSNTVFCMEHSNEKSVGLSKKKKKKKKKKMEFTLDRSGSKIENITIKKQVESLTDAKPITTSLRKKERRKKKKQSVKDSVHLKSFQASSTINKTKKKIFENCKSKNRKARSRGRKINFE